jgi:hypothetical protein
MATPRRLISGEELVNRRTPEEWKARIQAYLAEPRGGCDACRFADPFSDHLCTLLDIRAEDFDLGVSGINCSRFQPREARETIELRAAVKDGQLTFVEPAPLFAHGNEILFDDKRVVIKLVPEEA